MSLEDLPILRAGTTLKFEEYKDRRAEVRYHREDGTIVHLLGYVPGIFPKDNYMDRAGKIFYKKGRGTERRLLLIREVKIHNDCRGEDIWDDNICEEIPILQIFGYKEMH